MKAIISLGSNCGNRTLNIEGAVAFIESLVVIESESGIFESPDYKGRGKKYQNNILIIDSTIDYNELNLRFKEFEVSSGRNSDCRERGEVPIDIDIVVWGEEIKKPVDYKSEYFKTGLGMLQADV